MMWGLTSVGWLFSSTLGRPQGDGKLKNTDEGRTRPQLMDLHRLWGPGPKNPLGKAALLPAWKE